MLCTLQQGLGRAIRASGSVFEFIGQKFEVHPYIEQCKFPSQDSFHKFQYGK